MSTADRDMQDSVPPRTWSAESKQGSRDRSGAPRARRTKRRSLFALFAGCMKSGEHSEHESKNSCSLSRVLNGQPCESNEKPIHKQDCSQGTVERAGAVERIGNGFNDVPHIESRSNAAIHRRRWRECIYCKQLLNTNATPAELRDQDLECFQPKRGRQPPPWRVQLSVARAEGSMQQETIEPGVCDGCVNLRLAVGRPELVRQVLRFEAKLMAEKACRLPSAVHCRTPKSPLSDCSGDGFLPSPTK